jgi:undecaprenyl-phosphate 4-deoxy-4-formamido-L-arabinose transferase
VRLSIVIPVYNGAGSIGPLVQRVHELYASTGLEVVLVDDGSSDDSEQVCRRLCERHPDTVVFVQLARNFGEHAAVLAGLAQTSGDYVAVIDDDGQNPPEEVHRLLAEIESGGHDVVYGRYLEKRHGLLRNAGSWFNDRVANVMLKKPKELYLSSFKILNRFTVDEIVRYRGAFPYIDGLILRTTSRLGQIPVEHRSRTNTQSGYTLRKLVRLWLNMFLNFSILPLRVSALLGFCASGFSLVALLAIVVDKLYLDPEVPVGIPTVLATIVFFSGVQLVILGTLGEYLGRVFLDQSNSPQYVLRYVYTRRTATARLADDMEGVSDS